MKILDTPASLYALSRFTRCFWRNMIRCHANRMQNDPEIEIDGWCFSPSFCCRVWKQRTLQGGKRLAKRQNYLLAQPASQYFHGMCWQGDAYNIYNSNWMQNS